MLFICSSEIISVVVPEPCITFFWIPASIAEAAAVIPNLNYYLQLELLHSLMDLLFYLIVLLKFLQNELF